MFQLERGDFGDGGEVVLLEEELLRVLSEGDSWVFGVRKVGGVLNWGERSVLTGVLRFWSSVFLVLLGGEQLEGGVGLFVGSLEFRADGGDLIVEGVQLSG